MSAVTYPFSEFVVKIHERCNLKCDYCYMYEMVDQTWRDRPTKMGPEVFEKTAARIVDHAREHALSHISLIFHGGEPLLRGSRFIGWATAFLRSQLSDLGTTLRAQVQTNGTKLDLSMLSVLREHDIEVGVSLDGPQSANDRHRLGHLGQSSFEATIKGVEFLTKPTFRHLFRGFLVTIDTRNNPVETFDFLQTFKPPMIEFLLPHANWETLPARGLGDSPTPYADWLITLFDHWYTTTEHSTTIRFFHNIIVCLMGGQSEVETVGLTPVCTAFIETDGTINQVDALKSAFSGATDTSLDVFHHSFTQALAHPDIRARQQGIVSLAAQCRSCDLVTACGGGHYPHRYRPGNGFNNPSVYCADLMKLINHIREQLHVDLTSAMQLELTTRGDHNEQSDN